jgi:hypothetical protein
VLSTLSASSRAVVTGRSFFPHLISSPFSAGLHEAFLFAIVACLIAAGASLLRGGKFHYVEPSAADAAQSNGSGGNVGNGNVGNGNVGSGNGPIDQGASELARITTAEEQHAR